VLHQVLPIINILLHLLQLLLVLHTLLQVQCIHLRMLHILLLLYNIHQMLEVHNIISRTALVRQFTHLPISHLLVQGKPIRLIF
jgi:hypothetical protein